MRFDPMATAKNAFRFGFGSCATMNRSRFVAHVLLVASSVLLSATANAQQSQPTPHASKQAKAAGTITVPAPGIVSLEPKAIDILKAASARLAAAHSMEFTSIVTYENPSRLGPPLAYTTKSEVTMERPDKLRVITLGDGPPSEFYYDGKTMTAFAPVEDLVAIAPGSAHNRCCPGRGLPYRRHLFPLQRRDSRRSL